LTIEESKVHNRHSHAHDDAHGREGRREKEGHCETDDPDDDGRKCGATEEARECVGGQVF
jgi:hypothetical protein